MPDGVSTGVGFVFGVLLALAVLVFLIVVVVPFLVVVFTNPRALVCAARGHDWRSVKPYEHTTGVLTFRLHYRCKRCQKVPTIGDEAIIMREALRRG